MEFNCQQFADLLRLALGDRSINKYGKDSDVDPGYISRILRCKTKHPPSADIIRKLANKAYNGITAEQFQEAAGYLPGTTAPEPKKPKDLQKFLEQEDFTLNGRMATPEDRERLIKMYEAMYWEAKQLNKRK